MPRRYAFEREYRTAYSEGYVLFDEDNEIGRVEVHFTPGFIRATLCVPETSTEEEISEIIEEIENQIAMSRDPYREEEFEVKVWAGHSGGEYSTEDDWDSEDEWDEEEDEDEEDERDGNGRRP